MKADVLVIGGDTNALTTACYLARAGREVTLLSHGPIGGLASRHEFHPGYHSPGALSDSTLLRPRVVQDLELERHGLRSEERAAVLVIGPEAQFEFTNQVEETVQSIDRISAKDAASYRRLSEFIDTVRDPIERFLGSSPPDLIDPDFTDLRQLLVRGFQLRRLGKKAMLELLRLAPMAVYDWMDEWFENDLVKAGLALPAVVESYTGPWSAGTNANLLVRLVTQGHDVVGDGLALADALIQAAQHRGVKVRDLSVASIEPGVGIVTTEGESIEAKTIVTSLDPKLVFLELVRPELLERRFERRIQNFRTRGLRSQLLLALDRAPELPGSSRARHLRLASTLDAIERSFDPIKYGRAPDQPTLELYLPSTVHPDLAPEGHAVASVTIHYTPYALEGGWTAEARDELVRTAIGQLDSCLPGISETVVGHELLTPPDLERRYRVHGGHVFQGELALDQLLVRPTPECCRYETPFAEFYLCGGGSFPGGGLTCAPGALAARTISRSSRT